ncbi:hypothetical protein RGQ29_007806 [Quercus rubra]|uniref:Uncharacterized protein n=1 Tax=Quercus rubra TaxID=3512 RepID=A0AAN7I3F9_QUERU|nr:hypothetical protein RGQ29_007806 [Quercus rubra]
MDNTTPTAPTPAPMWSIIVKSQPPPKPNPETPTPSTRGIAVAVVNANTLIEGDNKLTRSANKLVTISEVMVEVRDPTSHHCLSFLLPSSLHSMNPSPDSLNKVIKFARATGDLQTLSDVDLKLIVLTYTLEAQIYGTKHIRDCPPPVHVANAKRLLEKELPSWGSIVPSLGEWEALERASIGDGGEVEGGVSGVRPRRFFLKKKEVMIEGKKMVASGIDASQEVFDEDAGNWMSTVSRSTYRQFLRRKARQDAEKNRDSDIVEDGRSLENEIKEGENGDESLSTILEQMRLEEEEDTSNGLLLEGNELDISSKRLGSSNPELAGASFESNEAEVDDEDEVDMVNEGLDHVEMSSQADESLHRWILKCHACYTVTAEIGRIFCPKCGNGGTLRKVAVTVGENGIFSLPLPQGGREAIAKNLILREDQLPQKFLHPKTKKKMNKQVCFDDFGRHVDKRAPLQPPVRKALAVFSGKRDPNDNHFSRSKYPLQKGIAIIAYQLQYCSHRPRCGSMFKICDIKLGTGFPYKWMVICCGPSKSIGPRFRFDQRCVFISSNHGLPNKLVVPQGILMRI